MLVATGRISLIVAGVFGVMVEVGVVVVMVSRIRVGPAMNWIRASGAARRALPVMHGEPTNDLGEIGCQKGYGENLSGKAHE